MSNVERSEKSAISAAANMPIKHQHRSVTGEVCTPVFKNFKNVRPRCTRPHLLSYSHSGAYAGNQSFVQHVVAVREVRFVLSWK